MTIQKYSFPSFKSNLSILVIGDIMLDHFVYGNVDRISPEAPIPVLKLSTTKTMLGGAGNVAVNLADLGCTVSLLSLVGDDEDGIKINYLLKQYANISAYILIDTNRPTTSKTRFVCGKQHLLRLDNEETAPISQDSENYFISFLKQFGDDYDIIIISDYNKGLLTKNIKYILCNEIKIPHKIVDSKNPNISDYANTDIIVPNIKELESYTNSIITTQEEIAEESEDLIIKHNIMAVLTTCGAKGMFAVELTEKTDEYNTFNYVQIPTFNNNPIDVSGAGDTVVASLALGLGSGYNLEKSIWLASVAASIVIEKSGTASLNLAELLKKVEEIQRINK